MTGYETNKNRYVYQKSQEIKNRKSKPANIYMQMPFNAFAHKTL